MSDQFEFQCPQCKRRTVVPADQNEEDAVYCKNCDVAMVKKAAVSEITEASANAPARSSDQAVAVATKTARKSSLKTKTGATKTRSTAARTRAAAAAVPVVEVVIPEFGSFRCPCCGMAKTIAPGEGKAGVPARCQTCFVKLEFLK